MLFGLVALAGAADVLVPEATPRGLDDFSVAFMFYQMVVDAAGKEGLDLDDAEVIRGWAGAEADGCWDNEACPANLWDRTGARLAIVMSVGQAEGGLEIDVRLHGAEEPAPFKVLRELVPPGGEVAFAAEVARAMTDALPLLPERPDPSPPRIRPKVAPPPEEPPADEPPPRKLVLDEDAVELPSNADEPVRASDQEDERRKMGIPARAYARYRESGLDRKDWLAANRVRSGRAWLEAAGGWGLGDVDRGYSVRARISDSGGVFEQTGMKSWEGAGAGAGPTGWLAIGYAATWFLDTSVAVGVQYGEKHLDTGWECLDGACTEPSSEEPFDAVQSVQLVVEPRFRLIPLATGVVKPYALVAFTLRVHDGFTVPDVESVDYPDAYGGASFGPTAGLGVMVDPVAPLSIFVEAPATLILSPASQTTNEGAVDLATTSLSGTGTLFRVVGGVAVRL